MKNTFFILSMVLLTINISYGQKLKLDKIPAVVLSEFKSKFPTAEKVKWSLENTKEYEAEFKINKIEQSANFSDDGMWIETEVEIRKSQLPQDVIDAIKKQYPNCKIDEVEQGSNPEISLFYAITLEFNDKDYDINLKPTGEIIKAVEVQEDEKD